MAPGSRDADSYPARVIPAGAWLNYDLRRHGDAECCAGVEKREREQQIGFRERKVKSKQFEKRAIMTEDASENSGIKLLVCLTCCDMFLYPSPDGDASSG